MARRYEKMTKKELMERVRALEMLRLDVELLKEGRSPGRPAWADSMADREVSELIQRDWKRYRELYEYAPVPYVTLERNGMILDINLIAARLLGRTRSALIRTPFVGLVQRDDMVRFLGHLYRCRTEGAATTARGS